MSVSNESDVEVSNIFMMGQVNRILVELIQLNNNTSNIDLDKQVGNHENDYYSALELSRSQSVDTEYSYFQNRINYFNACNSPM